MKKDLIAAPISNRPSWWKIRKVLSIKPEWLTTVETVCTLKRIGYCDREPRFILRWNNHPTHPIHLICPNGIGQCSYGYGVRYTPAVDTLIPQIKILQETKISEDLRRYPRKHFSNSVFFTSRNGYFEGLINNISKNGVFIKTQDDFTVGQMVRIVIPGTKIDNGTMLKGEIRHQSKKGIGIQFKQLLKAKLDSNQQVQTKSACVVTP
jgi:hypothetical protein